MKLIWTCMLLCVAVVTTKAYTGDNMDGMMFMRTSEREQQGCSRVGHTRRVQIPDCVAFQITTNGCRGICESWSIPSTFESLIKHPGKMITSLGQCCNIMQSEDVSVRVMCVGGPRDIVFKSAKTCSCFTCKKD